MGRAMLWSISARALGNIRLDLPRRPEQEAIALVIRDLDLELDALEARQAKVVAVRQAMMQELLPGRIRLETAEDDE